MSDVFVVVQHGDLRDPEISVHASQEAAVAKAKEWVAEAELDHDDALEWLPSAMLDLGWVYNVSVGSEYITVIRRELDES
jgi:hypothetical protein